MHDCTKSNSNKQFCHPNTVRVHNNISIPDEWIYPDALRELPLPSTAISADEVINGLLTTDESWLAQLDGRGSSSSPSERVDAKCSRSKPQPTNLFVVTMCCFSIKRNLRLIGRHHHDVEEQPEATTSRANNMGDVKVIHGIRTLTMIWIIFGHSIGLVSPEMMSKYQ